MCCAGSGVDDRCTPVSTWETRRGRRRSAKLAAVSVRAEQVSRRVDHVVIEADDEEELFSFFTDVLGLPTAWPVAKWGFIHEGGVGVGNCNLGCNHTLDPNADPTPTVRAIALEPAGALPAVVEELERRGLTLTEPMASGPIALPDTEPFAPWQRGWTTVMIFGAPLDPLPFICAYDHDVEERARAEGVTFDATHGGAFGITDLRAVIVHTDDVDGVTASWATLLGHEALKDNAVLALPEGPELRIRHGTSPPALVFGVRSVDDAAGAARSLGISCESGEQIRLDPADALGLDIRLE